VRRRWRVLFDEKTREVERVRARARRVRIECVNGVVVDVDQAFVTYWVIRRQCMKLVRARERHVAGQSRARDAKSSKVSHQSPRTRPERINV
jgi:hypothetical protein